jgi:hypothetical protein
MTLVVAMATLSLTSCSRKDSNTRKYSVAQRTVERNIRVRPETSHCTGPIPVQCFQPVASQAPWRVSANYVAGCVSDQTDSLNFDLVFLYQKRKVTLPVTERPKMGRTSGALTRCQRIAGYSCCTTIDESPRERMRSICAKVAEISTSLETDYLTEL